MIRATWRMAIWQGDREWVAGSLSVGQRLFCCDQAPCIALRLPVWLQKGCTGNLRLHTACRDSLDADHTNDAAGWPETEWCQEWHRRTAEAEALSTGTQPFPLHEHLQGTCQKALLRAQATQCMP